MPTNEEGVEVNEDGSEIAPEQLETSDWTNVLKLMENDNVKPLDMETLAPTSVPHNIPYLEVYRTDEVYFKSYESPFLSNSGNTSYEAPTTEDMFASDEEENVQTTGEKKLADTVKNSINESKVHSSKTKNSKMSTEMTNFLKHYYKSNTNFKVLVQRYMNAKTNKLSVGVVTARSKNNLKSGIDANALSQGILRIKRKYG